MLLLVCFLCFTSSLADFQPRIFNGQAAGVDLHFPYIVAIVLEFTTLSEVFELEPEPQHVCGGSILSSFWVVSAAHCFDMSHLDEVRVVAGTTKLSLDNPFVRPSIIIIHPDYKSYNSTFYADICLIRLQQELVFSDKIKPISIGDFRIGKKLLAAGWGKIEEYKYTSELQYVSMVSVERDSHLCVTNKWKFCAVRPGSNDATICKGDSGGPVEDVERKTLVGISSHTWTKCSKSKRLLGSQFIRLDYYKSWIMSYVATDEPRRYSLYDGIKNIYTTAKGLVSN